MPACAGMPSCSFMPQQAGRVAVLVQLRGEGVGGSPFFISFGAGPTAATQCSLRLSDGAPPPTAGEPLQLTLRAADAAANARREGGDRFVVSVHGAAQFDVTVRDCGDGSYALTLTPSLTLTLTLTLTPSVTLTLTLTLILTLTLTR